MSDRKKPSTQKEMIYQMWYAILGTNGDGLIEQVKILKEEFNNHITGKEKTCFYNQAMAKRSGVKIRKTDMFFRVASIVFGLFTILLSVIAGKAQGWW